uniref:Uncharacterized protein n=1 Tax=Plectus sambesii TaxID=2011161 RepID=A0A914UYI0_9BILA
MSQHVKCPASGLYGTPPSVNFFTHTMDDDDRLDDVEAGDPTL